MQLTSANLPFRIEVFDTAGNLLTSRQLTTALINPGQVQKVSKSAYLSADTTDPLRLDHAISPTYIPGNNQLRVCYKNSALGMILDALKEINRQPYGCFEQASATTFPLIIALQILNQMPETPEVVKLREEMLKNLKIGIELLKKYLC